ncbi:Uncharacterized HTH-type transcriptional regulator YdhC, partial [Durusdinium trenchii]
LVEKDLCVQLNVSRTSLREALRELEGEGVVAQESARGLTVVKISQRDAQNIYRIRADVEALIFEQFLMNADDTELAEAMRLCDAMVLSYETGAFSGIVEAKRRFYDHMCNVADNRVARDLLAKLTLRTAQLRRRSVVRKERQEQSILEITALKEALSSRPVQKPLTDDAEDLWAYAVALYGRDGVSDACLELQERFDADVPVLLYALWLAGRGCRLTPASMVMIDAEVGDWRREIAAVENRAFARAGFRDRQLAGGGESGRTEGREDRTRSSGWARSAG